MNTKKWIRRMFFKSPVYVFEYIYVHEFFLITCFLCISNYNLYEFVWM